MLARHPPFGDVHPVDQVVDVKYRKGRGGGLY